MGHHPSLVISFELIGRVVSLHSGAGDLAPVVGADCLWGTLAVLLLALPLSRYVIMGDMHLLCTPVSSSGNADTPKSTTLP